MYESFSERIPWPSCAISFVRRHSPAHCQRPVDLDQPLQPIGLPRLGRFRDNCVRDADVSGDGLAKTLILIKGLVVECGSLSMQLLNGEEPCCVAEEHCWLWRSFLRPHSPRSRR